jgi:alkanesulfonate monooxygenase SsuD/methylene tetrahydromethanopterin reductase-like flavin-dependent oxidoreductase (luciferase family)
MKFSIQLATERVDRPEEFLTADAIAEMARAAEGAGFDACFVTDHPIPEEAWLASGGHHALDPFVALAFAAAATSRIRLHTNLLILPYRNPFLTAKAAATLDVASGGRLILGVGAGYLEGEFAALGVDRSHRNELSDAALESMKQAWSGASFEAAGHTVAALPRPAQRPTAAIASLYDLRPRLDYAREHAAKVGRAEPLDVVFIPLGFSMRRGTGAAVERLANDVPAYAEAGVTWLSLGVPCETRAEYCDRVRELGEAIAPLR